MSDLICRKTMMRCQTPGMCAPYGGCQPLPVTESVFKTDYARLEQECERLRNELNNMRISWGLMQSEREAALKQVERLTAMLHRASKAESRPEFMQIIAEALSAKP